MEDIIIQETERTPEVKLLISEGLFSIQGESFPEDVAAFYGQVISAIDKLVGKLDKKMRVVVALIYTNSSSIKALYRIFEGLDAIRQSGGDLDVIWSFQEDDDIMEELGEDFRDRFPDLGMQITVQD